MALTQQIRPIRTREQYEEYLQEVELLLSDASQDARDRLEVLILLLNDYETRHFPMPPPDPIEAIKFWMEQKGLKPRDLEQYIGPRQHVHDVLHGKRALSKAMIQRLHRGLGIPYEALLGS